MTIGRIVGIGELMNVGSIQRSCTAIMLQLVDCVASGSKDDLAPAGGGEDAREQAQEQDCRQDVGSERGRSHFGTIRRAGPNNRVRIVKDTQMRK